MGNLLDPGLQQTLGVSFAAAAMLVLPLRAVVRLRRRGRADLAPLHRLVFASAAAAITLLALLNLDEPADTVLSAHMLQHMLVGDLVPLLFVLAVRGPLCVHLVPVPLMRAWRAVARPIPAFVVWAAALAVWHVPVLYDAALEHERLHAFEHATFMLGGFLVWSVLLDPARRRLLPGWRRFAYAVGLLAASGALANVLVLSYRPLYPDYAGDEPRPFALTPLGDQNLAAVLMMLEQVVTLGTFAALSARKQLRAVEPQAPRHPIAV